MSSKLGSKMHIVPAATRDILHNYAMAPTRGILRFSKWLRELD
jgi:hypothetical protein